MMQPVSRYNMIMDIQYTITDSQCVCGKSLMTPLTYSVASLSRYAADADAAALAVTMVT